MIVTKRLFQEDEYFGEVIIELALESDRDMNVTVEFELNEKDTLRIRTIGMNMKAEQFVEYQKILSEINECILRADWEDALFEMAQKYVISK